ncbi:LacI family DNA-binding transcriptional regulator [Fictibacillus fluitans]|uniref:LacI family DNA-binding transcriptional regulator n=1 Tax=Fictibacillus fluitans TaxID=3058422 RepID=A0ABT8HQG4_9BACL|nr:LacI family DNA-binding transcriptional regulator [Fictibacillus sp. NE201]MDN4523013.1 LacI family DNA-binding transcriptional regulator [Fictibacillus sp. NE201]
MSVTIKDIARASGVSYSTVSKALNDSSLVKPETKRKVVETAKALGYTPNLSAKNLVSKKSRTIGLVWPSLDRVALTELVAKINNIVTEKNYFMILSVNAADHAVKMFESFQVDGILLFEGGIENQLPPLFSSSVPIITYGVARNGHPYPIVDVNHKAAISKAVEHLVSLGHKNIHYIGEDSHADKRQYQKWTGFQEAMNNAHLPVNQTDTKGLGWYDGYLAAQKVLGQESLPTALISGSYDISIGILRAVKERHLRIPEDLSLVSYDNIPQMASLETALTSVGVPIDSLAETMVESLLSLIETKDTAHSTKRLDPEIHIRKSTSIV